LATILIAGCGSHAGSGGPSPAALEHCQVVVTTLLSNTVTAMGQGYSMGIDISQVERRYGTMSAIFETFMYADSKVLLYVDQRGPAGSLASVRNLVRDDCRKYASKGS